MHALTKFLVILGAILSIFLSAMVIAYATNTDRIARDYDSEIARRVAADAGLQASVAQSQSESAASGQRITTLEAKVSQLMTESSNKDLEIANLKTEKARAEAGSASLKARVDELSTIIQTAQTQTSNLMTETNSLRTSELNLRKQNFELETRLADVTSQRDQLELTRRSLLEQLENARGGGGTAIASNPAAGMNDQPIIAAQRIQGRVEEVRKDAANKTLVKINVGSNNGVQNRMKFWVARPEGGFVGTLTVIQTDLAFSVAQVELLGQNGEPQANDIVLSRLN